MTRYRNWDELFGYCRNSANPVGRLVLYLCGYSDAERQRLSDATCTALQLANFWQDVTVDLLKDRVYIPLEIMERHGYTVEELFARRFTPRFRRGDARNGGPGAGTFRRRAAAGAAWWTGAWQSTWTSSAAAACACWKRSNSKATTCWRRARRFRKMERVGLLLGSVARVAFSTRAA